MARAHDPQHILLIRPSALGDVCRTVPVLVSLRRALPSARIDWLVQDSFVDAVRAHPDVARVVPFARGALGRAMKRGRIGEVFSYLGGLRAERYDLVIDAQGLLRSALIGRASGARRRVGYANAQECGWVFNTERHALDRSMHTVDRMLGLVERAGIAPVRDMRLYAAEEDQMAARALVPEVGIVLAPTSRWAAKRWPIERFAALAERLLRESDEPITIIGAPGEEAQCGALTALAAREPRVTNLVGRTSIGQTMAIIERSVLVAACDSAALHMAVGFDRPIVALYGPTEVSRVGPYRREGDVIQHVTPGDKLDHKRAANVALMERIEVDEVLAACRARLGKS
ncbi:MAG: glycosyltransferase family 9 protein [Phycisphaeraceae bacterium]|nr:glycosyltransferase family 9 protein [Phycisphaeraceae bacterium]MCW5764138.1 glycosyltransferase family 9 protein [Phycisphaeraceae bacterium]